MIGRFAPTPSGELHLGSLVAALGSYLAAKSAGGQWLIRIDDLDQLRTRAGAEEKILNQLLAHGLQWDGPVYRQSNHLGHYDRALEQLADLGLTYACTCSRTRLWQLLPDVGPAGYPGFCRDAGHASGETAIRLNTAASSIRCGHGNHVISDEQPALHDFVVRRRDGIVGYELACSVDEQLMGVTHVVRGSDLDQSTVHQKLLCQLIGGEMPDYLALPLVQTDNGQKLSKHCETHTLDSQPACDNLKLALKILGQDSSASDNCDSVSEIIRMATLDWRSQNIPGEPYILA